MDAEASRALKAVPFASAEHRDRVAAEVVAEVARRAVLLSASELGATPTGLRRGDGASAFRPHRGEQYTSREILDAEARLLAAGRDRTGPTASPDPVHLGAILDDQHTAVANLAQSGRVVDVLVGPAGSGKTRTVAALRLAWEAGHGPGSVTGLAPSAAAASVLATALGVPTENTAKWLVEHDHEADRLRRIDQARAALHAAPDPSTAQTLRAHLDRLSNETVLALLNEMRQNTTQEQHLAAAEFMQVLTSTIGTTRSMSQAASSAATQMQGIGRFSLQLRPIVKKLSAAFRSIEDGQAIIDQWEPLIAEMLNEPQGDHETDA